MKLQCVITNVTFGNAHFEIMITSKCFFTIISRFSVFPESHSRGRSFIHSTAMRKLWRTASVLGPAMGALLWSKQQTAPSDPSSDYELKLVQVLFRHGARTPLKSIPDVMEVRAFPSDLKRLCAVRRRV